MGETLFWFFDLLLPVTMILLGVIYKYRYPAYPEKGKLALFGYRTSYSMKSNEAWDFAHQEYSKVLFKVGVFTTAIITISKLFPIMTVELLSLVHLAISFGGFIFCSLSVGKKLKDKLF